MKKIPLLLLALCSPTLFAAETVSNSNPVSAVIDALNPTEKPDCYHFTDEIPPEEFIGYPECDLTPPKLTGSVEVGTFFNTSDNDYFITKARSDLNHEIGKLRTNWIFDIFGRKSEVTDQETGKKRFETTDQKWLTSLQSNYTLEEGGQNYLFGYGSYETDRFNGFDFQAAIAAGWGRRWYETDTAYFDAEIGPGFKIDEIAQSPQHNNRTESAFIIRTAATYERQIYKKMNYKQTLSAELAAESGQNSKFKSVSSISTKLIESLALKFAFTIDHNTNVEGDIEKTRTETSLTLVYSI